MKNLSYLLKPVVIIICLLWYSHSNANNLSISNLQLTGQNTSAGSGSTSNYILVQFDLSWENSFRDTVNWDAVWVYIKYKTSSGTTWKHATLSITGNTAPSGSTISVPTDKKGAFIYRSDTGSGTFSLTAVQLKWYYALDTIGDDDTYDIKVMGCEMVYVPQATYSLGAGGGSESYTFYKYGSSSYGSYSVSSESAITMGTSSGNLYARGYGPSATLSASFPKGYQAFYCMKYEISQGQYLEFLNCLTRTQQNYNVNCTLSADAPSKAYVLSNYATLLNRNYLTCPTSGNGTTNPVVFTCTAPTLVCNMLSWQEVAAYLDWSALRPITELEYEKACRGHQTPTSQEFAWGTTSPGTGNYNLSYRTTDSEYVSNASSSSSTSNCIYSATAAGSSMDGKTRCGVFANSSSNRTTSGASYYGIMELSGSVWERVVGIYTSTGRSFTGSHGDGNITSGGYANNSDWPGYSSGNITGGTGSAYRGGSMSYGTDRLRVSDRNWAGSTDYAKHQGRGGRG
ncbi:MAG: SUMF1/EgtB/PvdO family nonheme iron enzyme [Bacteroidota bacterium]|nr:SUMF1/EgtB/PvdO family nonheme iron enzyme [Bacteroidota bacterium]